MKKKILLMFAVLLLVPVVSVKSDPAPRGYMTYCYANADSDQGDPDCTAYGWHGTLFGGASASGNPYVAPSSMLVEPTCDDPSIGNSEAYAHATQNSTNAWVKLYHDNGSLLYMYECTNGSCYTAWYNINLYLQMGCQVP